MSKKQETSGRRSVQVEVEVPGMPGEVWQAIAAKQGVSSWLALAEFEKRGRNLPRYVRAILTCVAILILLPSMRAQEPQKPGKEYDDLKRLVGTWDAETANGNGIMTYKMDLGGLWLIGDFEGEFGGVKLQGKFLDTYDSAAKKYRSIWLDSLSSAPRIMEGNLEKDNNVMTMTGEGPLQPGKTAKFESITEMKDADTVNFTLFMVDREGKQQPIVKITYKRKK
jgi:hypothetical protein